MALGDWFNIREKDSRRYSQALSRYSQRTGHRFVCKSIGGGIFRIVRYD